MSLAKVPAGNSVMIDSISASPELRLRFQTLGLLSGKRIEVLKNDFPCPVVIGAAGARLMLGRELAAGLAVTPAACSAEGYGDFEA
jgi:Fe2+ transport system protein FeoA